MRGEVGEKDPPADQQRGPDWTHLLQPRYGWPGKGAVDQGDRCPRRGDRAGNRPFRDPVPDPQYPERTGGALIEGPDRPADIPERDARGDFEPAKPLGQGGDGYPPSGKRPASSGGTDADWGTFFCATCHPDDGNVLERPGPHRADPFRGGTFGGFPLCGPFGIFEGIGAENGTSENGYDPTPG